MSPLVTLQKKVYASILRKELPRLLALSSGASNQSLQNIVIQLRKACSHPYLFPGIEPEPYQEGEHLVQACGKLIVLDKLLRRLHDSGHRVLLFAQMTHTLDILQDYMELRNYSYERLDGSIRAKERFAAIRSFSRQSAKGSSEADQNSAFVFMISTRAWGVGLNLVAADTFKQAKDKLKGALLENSPVPLQEGMAAEAAAGRRKTYSRVGFTLRNCSQVASGVVLKLLLFTEGGGDLH